MQPSLFTLITLALIAISFSSSFQVRSAAVIADDDQSDDSNINLISRNFEPLDPNETYLLRWEVDLERNNITFTLVVETLGYVGFGISRGSGMTYADIIIGGVYDNGTIYFSDMHGVGNRVPVVDDKQDWVLISAQQSENQTTLVVSRVLNTCDEQDVAITADTLTLIWSFGNSDDLEHHRSNRGSYVVNLLDPPMPPFDDTGVETWTISADRVMPSQKTTYWCSIHKTPATHTQTRHIVGFNTRLDTPESLKHTHHLSVYKCTPPEGESAEDTFGHLVSPNHPGGECYLPPDEQAIPTDLCRSMIYVWAVGGKIMSFPEHVGFPLNENGTAEYFMMEIHYDNPDQTENLRFESAVEVYNTRVLRPQEAAVLVVSHSLTFSHTLPPTTESYMTVGHCSSQCTRDTVDHEGMNFFNVLLHAHVVGRKIKLRQFRGRQELPWITNDDGYNFDYQQNRPLREHTKVWPGDHLTVECVTDTTSRPNVTIAGLGTTEEMCQAIIWYYPRQKLLFCESAYNEWNMMERFGIEDISWDNILLPPVVLAPENMANKSYVEVVSTMFNWTEESIAGLQQETRYNNHYQAACGDFSEEEEKSLRTNRRFLTSAGKSKRNDPEVIGYPEIDSPYEPANPCFRDGGSGSTTTIKVSVAIQVTSLLLAGIFFGLRI